MLISLYVFHYLVRRKASQACVTPPSPQIQLGSRKQPQPNNRIRNRNISIQKHNNINMFTNISRPNFN